MSLSSTTLPFDPSLLPSMEKRLAEEIERRRQRKIQAKRNGLIEFVRYFWDVLEPHTTLVDGWPLEAICQHLEAVTFGEITRLLINVPPGFMKSLLTDVFWPAWEWSAINRPHLRYVTFSYSSSLTERDNGRFRDLLMHRKFQELWGDRFELRKIGEVKVTNDKTGFKLATSVEGVGTGERGDRVIADDLHNIKDTESVTIRTETVRWFRESMSNRLNDIGTSAIVVIMQRVHEGDVSGIITKEYNNYVHLMIPMEYDSTRHCETEIGWSDPRTIDGDLAWPERFPEHDVAELSIHLGRFAYSAQYQQIPIPRGGGILKPEWWEIWDSEEAARYGLEWNSETGKQKEYPEFGFILASLDTAYGKKKENDYSALTIWGSFLDRNKNRKWMLVFAWQARLEFHELVQRVAKDCKRYSVSRLLVEGKASGISVEQEMRRAYAREEFAVELVTPVHDKLTRAHSIVYLFTDKMIWIPSPSDISWADMVVDECAFFPKGTHDDIPDSVTQALGWIRKVGLAERRDEREADEWDAKQYRKRNKEPLYPGME